MSTLCPSPLLPSMVAVTTTRVSLLTKLRIHRSCGLDSACKSNLRAQESSGRSKSSRVNELSREDSIVAVSGEQRSWRIGRTNQHQPARRGLMRRCPSGVSCQQSSRGDLITYHVLIATRASPLPLLAGLGRCRSTGVASRCVYHCRHRGFTVPVPKSLYSIERGSRQDVYSCDMPLCTEHPWKGGMTGQATVA